jgi:hypothetical protein
VLTSGPGQPSVLHVVVGHGLPGYFLNAVRSVRAAAPGDHLLVIDNASPAADLRADLARLASRDDEVDLILRTENDLRQNRKVGGLYPAYELAFEAGIDGGYDFLHLIQADFQTLWWDAELVARSAEIFAARPQCLNLHMQFLSRDRQLTGELEPAGDGLLRLRRYGLADTGLYHLGRWRDRSMRWGRTEREHGGDYRAAGLEVIWHPWPADAPIPWPAVIRDGVQRGREITTTRPYLLRPPSGPDVARLKSAPARTWLEDICVPWGWACASPMWVTGLDSLDYWVLRYRDARRNGLGRLLPRPELRGIRPADWRGLLLGRQYRPSLLRLLLVAPLRGLAAEARRVLGRGKRSGPDPTVDAPG